MTAVVNKPISNFKSPNYTEILIDPPLDLTTIPELKDGYQGSEQDDFKNIPFYETATLASSKHALNTKNVQKLIHSNDLHFDLIINNEMFHEAWLMFGYKFNAPVVTICNSLRF